MPAPLPSSTLECSRKGGTLKSTFHYTSGLRPSLRENQGGGPGDLQGVGGWVSLPSGPCPSPQESPLVQPGEGKEGHHPGPLGQGLPSGVGKGRALRDATAAPWWRFSAPLLSG